MLLTKILVCHHLLKVRESDEQLLQTAVVGSEVVHCWGDEGYSDSYVTNLTKQTGRNMTKPFVHCQVLTLLSAFPVLLDCLIITNIFTCRNYESFCSTTTPCNFFRKEEKPHFRFSLHVTHEISHCGLSPFKFVRIHAASCGTIMPIRCDIAKQHANPVSCLVIHTTF